MPRTLKLGKDGQLVDESGSPVQIDGEPVVLEGVVTQDTLNDTIKQRLERQRQQAEKNKQELIAQYEEKLQSGKLTDEEREQLETRIHELETSLEDKSKQAERRAKQERERAAQEIETARTQAKRWETNFKRLKVETDLMNAAYQPDEGIDFVDHRDLFKRVEDNIVWEDVIDEETQKPTGQQRYVIVMPVKDKESGKEIEKRLSAKEAAQVVATNAKHLLRPRGKPGSGSYPPHDSPRRPGKENWRDAEPAEKMAIGLEG